MKIKFNQRVETQHKWIDEVTDKVKYQKLEFAKDVEVDMTEILPRWDILAQKMVGYGCAVEVA